MKENKNNKRCWKLNLNKYTSLLPLLYHRAQMKLTTSKSLSNPLSKMAAGNRAAKSTIPKSLSTTAIEADKREGPEEEETGDVEEEDLNNNKVILDEDKEEVAPPPDENVDDLDNATDANNQESALENG